MGAIRLKPGNKYIISNCEIVVRENKRGDFFLGQENSSSGRNVKVEKAEKMLALCVVLIEQ